MTKSQTWVISQSQTPTGLTADWFE